jgi:glycosyltransferase involved in cell wall biosynthesis
MGITIHNTLTTRGKLNYYPRKKSQTDICLMLEGTYPFVSGGVSSWVHSLIRGLPDFTFNLFVILPDDKKRKLSYEIPENVNALFLHPLNKASFLQKSKFPHFKTNSYLDNVLELHRLFSNSPSDNTSQQRTHTSFTSDFESKNLITMLESLSNIFENQNWSIPDRIFAKKTWEAVNRMYREKKLDCSFVDYYWTWRYLHLGIFSLMNAYIPKAGIYHAISTGYAGLIGARASTKFKAPLILTEHGIYNKERKIDISRSPWIYEEKRHQYRAEANLEVFKELWIKAFTIMSKICYEASSSIITLYTGNQEFQKQDGANPEIMRVIPNGIDYNRLSGLKREAQPKKVIGFVGRIVPIKDVKTFLRAISIVLKSYPEAEAWLMGPTDENEQYYDECLQLVEFLDISDSVKFTGMVDLKSYYPKLDILVLTSISEAQPLVILEAFSLGIPAVASDVGACRELLEGVAGDDAALGKAGLITGLASPAETALSILHLLRHPNEVKKMGIAGKKRVKLYYDLPKLFSQYKSIYNSYLKN